MYPYNKTHPVVTNSQQFRGGRETIIRHQKTPPSFLFFTCPLLFPGSIDVSMDGLPWLLCGSRNRLHYRSCLPACLSVCLPRRGSQL